MYLSIIDMHIFGAVIVMADFAICVFVWQIGYTDVAMIVNEFPSEFVVFAPFGANYGEIANFSHDCSPFSKIPEIVA